MQVAGVVLRTFGKPVDIPIPRSTQALEDAGQRVVMLIDGMHNAEVFLPLNVYIRWTDIYI